MPKKRKRRRNIISAAESGTVLSPESTDFDAAEESFIRYCRIKNLAEKSVVYYRNVLRELRRLLMKQGITEPRQVTKEVFENCLLEKRDAGARDVTVEAYFRGWRAFFNWLYENGFVTVNPAAGVKIKSEQRIIETFTQSQIQKLLSAPDRNTFTGYRDYVIMLTLLDTGVRISELVRIETHHIRWKERTILIYGKGRKERLVPFQTTLERHLREYINIRGPLDHDFVFVNIDNSPIKIRTVQQNLSRYGAAAGIKDVRVSPHTFRHTFAKLYVMNGGDPFSLQKILGHTSLEIVRMYVNLFSVDIADQHRKYSPLERIKLDGKI